MVCFVQFTNVQTCRKWGNTVEMEKLLERWEISRKCGGLEKIQNQQEMVVIFCWLGLLIISSVIVY